MIREVDESLRKEFDELAAHPLQSWEWGEFRKKTEGVEVLRLGWFTEEKLTETAQVTFHKIPKLPFMAGYWPKGVIPSKEMVEAVMEEAKKRRVIFVKMEPNVLMNKGKAAMEELKGSYLFRETKSLFTKWSFWLDLTKSEEELLAGMKSKTRYNVRYSERKGVKVMEDNSEAAFEEYWKLMEETTNRQAFYAHTKSYHLKMFETLRENGMAHLFRAVYKGKTLVTWIVFLLNDVLYYPYGASTRENRNVFPSEAMMWAVIQWGKSKGAKIFDLWGSPGPEPKEDDPWIGFHRFKLGFGAELVEFVGSYDLVVNKNLYPLAMLGDKLRWAYLRLKKN